MRRTASPGRRRALRDDAVIRISLPGTAVPAGRTVVTVQGLDAPWAPWHADMARPGGNGSNGSNGHRDDAGDGDDGPGDPPGDPARLAELIVRGPERVALIGPNGAGKTTLLLALAGLASPGHETGPAACSQ